MGIIPARAGFTVAVTPPHGPCGDHPRSRGVYSDSPRTPATLSGSSPLARGLLRLSGDDAGDVGIIPARAGFTFWPCASTCPAADHPRSRGVYFDFFRSDIHSGGSSPLARGLQGGPALCWAGTRIIPARAGFTSSRAHSPGSQRDHPRSRGVYVDSGHAHAGLVGIIPARAGFTTRRGTGMPSTSDHPRSRGVYPACLASTRAMMGSSPLARGLRARRSGQPSSRGIIPARAGFTATVRAAGLSWRDHPRSRGVYKARPPYAGRALGSSPLARGLPAWPCRPWP